MSTQRRSEPHPFVSYADASHICKHCDGGEFAACHQEDTIRQQSRAVRNMPPVVACDNCGLHYYQTSAPHVCAGWTTKEKVMSTTIEKPCGDCFNKSHTHQIVDYPVGARVEAVIDIPIYQGTVRAGTRGTVSSHCDDGRAYVSFDSGDAGHTFHQPEAYIRVIDRSEGDWCDDCHSYTHMPWCPSYAESEPSMTDADKIGALVRATGEETLIGALHWIQKRRNEHEPVARGGESGQSGLFPRYSFAVVTGRYKILDNRSDGPVRITQIATADGESEARTIVQALNQHHSLLAERDNLRRLLKAATSPTKCYCDVMVGNLCWQCEARAALNDQKGE